MWLGEKGYRRYDLRSALSSTGVKLALAVMEQHVKQNYDLEQWSLHFQSREAADAWVHTNTVVPVLSPFAAMEELANGQDVQFHIAWAPHKMQFDGFDMSSSAPGSNDRADFMLAGFVGRSTKLVRICKVYHTTNVLKETTSGHAGIVVPEFRFSPIVISRYMRPSIKPCI